jgi:hypothetical protein
MASVYPGDAWVDYIGFEVGSFMLILCFGKTLAKPQFLYSVTTFSIKINGMNAPTHSFNNRIVKSVQFRQQNRSSLQKWLVEATNAK